MQRGRPSPPQSRTYRPRIGRSKAAPERMECGRWIRPSHMGARRHACRHTGTHGHTDAPTHDEKELLHKYALCVRVALAHALEEGTRFGRPVHHAPPKRKRTSQCMIQAIRCGAVFQWRRTTTIPAEGPVSQVPVPPTQITNLPTLAGPTPSLLGIATVAFLTPCRPRMSSKLEPGQRLARRQLVGGAERCCICV